MTCVRVFVRAGHRVSGGRTRPRLRLKGVETTKTGGLHPTKVPWEFRFGPSGPQDSHFSVLTPGPPRAPRIGPEATLDGPKRAPERAQRVVLVPQVPPVRPK